MRLVGVRAALLILLAASGSPSLADALETWRLAQATVRAWPLAATWTDRGAAITLSPGHVLQVLYQPGPGPLTIYLLDRPRPDLFRPLVTGGALIVPLPADRGDGLEAFRAAQRCLDLATGSPALAARRVGLIGEGVGAQAALILAALEPERVSFVCAADPPMPDCASVPATVPVLLGLRTGGDPCGRCDTVALPGSPRTSDRARAVWTQACEAWLRERVAPGADPAVTSP